MTKINDNEPDLIKLLVRRLKEALLIAETQVEHVQRLYEEAQDEDKSEVEELLIQYSKTLVGCVETLALASKRIDKKT